MYKVRGPVVELAWEGLRLESGILFFEIVKVTSGETIYLLGSFVSLF